MIHYYQQLGLRPGVGADEVKKAYRALARRYHPDVNPTPEANQLFLQITEAYRHVLSDLQLPMTTPCQDTVAFETLYQLHHYRTRRTRQTFKNVHSSGTPASTSVPPVLHFMMEGLVWSMSLFLVAIPFIVCYQLVEKGLDGWPSLAFFPLVIGGVCGMYQSARSHNRLLR